MLGTCRTAHGQVHGHLLHCHAMHPRELIAGPVVKSLLAIGQRVLPRGFMPEYSMATYNLHSNDAQLTCCTQGTHRQRSA